MTMRDADHPIWPIIRLTVLMIAMVLVLRWNASKFDWTEGKSIVELFLIAAGAEGVVQVLNHWRGGAGTPPGDNKPEGG